MANNLYNCNPREYGKFETGNSKADWYKDTWVRPAGVDTLEQMGFYDSTFDGNVCPTWSHDALSLMVWVDKLPEYAEMQYPETYVQYWITRCMYACDEWEDIPDGYDDYLIGTNDIAELVEFIKNYEYQDWTPPA